MDPDVAVARQLVYAFNDALDEGDPDALEYAEQQLAEFVDETDDGTADEVLVALLDLPLDGSTLPLLNEVSARLTRRGPGVVEALLEAALGDAPPELSLRDMVSVAGAVGALLEAATRSPDVPPRTENALSVLDAMAEGDLILGLIEVLEGPADERLKRAASEMLVDIGEPAVERLKMSLRDRDAEPWVVDTLVDIRERRDPGCRGDDATDDGDDEPATTTDDEAADDGADDGDEPTTPMTRPVDDARRRRSRLPRPPRPPTAARRRRPRARPARQLPRLCPPPTYRSRLRRLPREVQARDRAALARAARGRRLPLAAARISGRRVAFRYLYGLRQSSTGRATMASCAVCGTGLREGATHCTTCGTPTGVAPPPPPRRAVVSGPSPFESETSWVDPAVAVRDGGELGDRAARRRLAGASRRGRAAAVRGGHADRRCGARRGGRGARRGRRGAAPAAGSTRRSSWATGPTRATPPDRVVITRQDAQLHDRLRRPGRQARSRCPA